MQRTVSLLLLSLGASALALGGQTEPKQGHAKPAAIGAAGTNVSNPAPVAASTPVAAPMPGRQLAEPRPLVSRFRGPSTRAAALQEGRGPAEALASADFDQDGMPDLVVAHSGADGTGTIALHRGNVDALFPNSPAAKARRANGTFVDAPFLPDVSAFDTPENADFIGAGDFDADGHQDAVVARRGGAVFFWHRGDGKGSLGEATKVTVPGPIAALAVGDVNRSDDLEDIVVAVEVESGGRLLVFEGLLGALMSGPEEIPLSVRPSAIALGRVDDDTFADLAVANGKGLEVIRGRDRGMYMSAARRTSLAPPVALTVPLPFPVQSLALGDFDGKRGTEVALLDSSRRLAVIAAHDLLAGPAVLAHLTPEPIDAGGDPANAPAATLAKAKVSAQPGDDLLLLGQERSGVLARQSEGEGALRNRPLVRDLGAARSALGMRLGPPALDGLVLLIGGEAAPRVADIEPLGVFTVRNSFDSGPDSLRQAILEANVDPATLDTIDFDIPVSGPHIITPMTPLPDVTGPTIIDATMEPDVVRLDGSMQADDILRIRGGSSTIRDLSMGRQGGVGQAGIVLSDVGGNVVEGNLIGTNTDGTGPGPTLGQGIIVASPNNRIGGNTVEQRNVISGNIGTGIAIQPGADGTTIFGNYIGVNVAGTALVANRLGITLDHADACRIGGVEVGEGNVIANTDTEILIENLSAATLVRSNYIGANSAGTAGFGLGGTGIDISDSSYVTVGDYAGNGRNLILGHAREAVRIRRMANDTLYNAVVGNHIGVAADGVTAVGNGTGIRLETGPDNFIGGTFMGGRNVVSGNNLGIAITGTGSNTVTGNYVGVSASGTSIVPNGAGIDVASPDNQIGGPDVGNGNVISGNTGNGITVRGASAANNRVQSNRIGTDPAGTLDFGNSRGIEITGDGVTTIGGTVGTTGNLISGNGQGIRLSAGAGHTNILGNLIGTNAAGTAAIPNGTGIYAEGGGGDIGGIVFPERNVISGNTNHGIEILAHRYLLSANYIGTTGDGSGALGNGGDGIRVQVPTSTLPDWIGIGDPDPGLANVIAYNGGVGVNVLAGEPVQIRGNSIHSNGGLGIDLGGDGVTPNDTGDGDTGPNGLQNFPEINVARALGTTLTVSGTLGTPGTVDVYVSVECDPLGNGEGANHIGTTPADATGAWSLTVSGPYGAGDIVTATATRGGLTSEFSACRTVVGDAPAAVGGMKFSSTDMISWEGTPGADLYHLYVGTVSTQSGLLTPINDSCEAAAIPETGGTLPAGANPPPGQMIWFLVTASNQYGEGPPQPASSGPRTLNSTGFCGDSCAHSTCSAGGPLDPACTLCTSIICAKDPHCCDPQNGSWDFACVQQMRTVCKSLTCPESRGQCAHELCEVGGGPLSPGCDTPPLAVSCTAAVCQADPHCCQLAWDEVCIARMATVCGYNCI